MTWFFQVLIHICRKERYYCRLHFFLISICRDCLLLCLLAEPGLFVEIFRKFSFCRIYLVLALWFVLFFLHFLQHQRKDQCHFFQLLLFLLVNQTELFYLL